MGRERNPGRRRRRQRADARDVAKARRDGGPDETPQSRTAATAPNKRKRKPTGPGLVERADGRIRRRLVVYVEPERAKQLKLQSVIRNVDMSDIVDGLLESWLEGEIEVG